MRARALTRREALAFAAARTLALTGCGEGSSAGAEPVDESAPAVSPSTITPVDPSGWDAQYYVPAHATGAEARAAAEEVARRVEAEGIVLLKNDDAALPLPAGTRVSLLGRSAAGTIFGGTHHLRRHGSRRHRHGGVHRPRRRHRAGGARREHGTLRVDLHGPRQLPARRRGTARPSVDRHALHRRDPVGGLSRGCAVRR